MVRLKERGGRRHDVCDVTKDGACECFVVLVGLDETKREVDMICANTHETTDPDHIDINSTLHLHAYQIMISP